jgi:hypothetical protein
MSLKLKSSWLAVLALWTLTNTGCFWMATQGPNIGPLGVPIPVSPFQQDQPEWNHHMHERYDRAPILGPIAAGGPTQALDTPSDDEVMRALEKARPVRGGVPFFDETQRNNVRIVKEKIADFIDPPRVVPLIGPVQLHHARYKCIIYFDERVRVGWPIPHTLEKPEEVEVVYIDHDHFHMVGNLDYGPGSPYPNP